LQAATDFADHVASDFRVPAGHFQRVDPRTCV
jgi:hypothetical protein